MTHQPPDASVPAPLSADEEAERRLTEEEVAGLRQSLPGSIRGDYHYHPLTVQWLLNTLDAERQARAADPRDKWWTDGAMVNGGLAGDEHFIGDAASADDAERIVDSHNAALAAAPARAAAPAPPVTDAMAEAAHDAWLAEKVQRLRAANLPESWPSETGEEQLVPWAVLSEAVREFDRIVVRAALGAAAEPAGLPLDALRDILALVEGDAPLLEHYRREIQRIARAALASPATSQGTPEEAR